jgi:hypothetical protein
MNPYQMPRGKDAKNLPQVDAKLLRTNNNDFDDDEDVITAHAGITLAQSYSIYFFATV